MGRAGLPQQEVLALRVTKVLPVQNSEQQEKVGPQLR